MRALVILASVTCIAAPVVGAGPAFPLPPSGAEATWEAEHGVGATWRKVQHPWASGGAYVEPADGRTDAVLEFRVTADRATSLQVWPIWWRHGEQLAARRFPSQIPWLHIDQAWPLAYPSPRDLSHLPYPLMARHGPDAIDVVGSRLSFTAPQAGLVGVVDLEDEKLIGAIDIGGYPADIVADTNGGRLFVADAARDRIVVLDAAQHTIAAEAKVPAVPRSIASADGRLYVASMQGRCISVLDGASLNVLQRVDLPVVPQHVEVRDGKILVWPLPSTWHPQTFQEHPADRLTYWPAHPFPVAQAEPPLPWETLAGKSVKLHDHSTVLFGSHVAPVRASVSPGPAPMALSITWPDGTKQDVDFSMLNDAGGAKPAGDLPDDRAPGRYTVVNDTLWFISPATGNVGYMPLHPGAKPGMLKVGGYLTDIAGFTGAVLGKYLDQNLCFLHSRPAGADYSDTHRLHPPKVFVCDAVGNRVVVIDPARRSIINEVPVGAMPVSMTLYGLELFVASRKAREVSVIEVWQDVLVRRHPLPAEPLTVDVARLQPRYTSSEFVPPVAADESPLRMMVEYQPLAFDLSTLQPVEPPAMSLRDAILYRRRAEQTWKPPKGKAKEILADNMHALRFDGSRWLDVAEVTDRLRTREPARLNTADRPGTIAVAVDDGEWNDWTRGIWLDPQTRRFLINNSPEFVRANAPALELSSGEHVVRIKASSPHARLDALRVWRSAAPKLAATMTPLPADVHDLVQSPSYQGIFASDEPVKYALTLRGGAAGESAAVRWRIAHPIAGDLGRGEQKVALDAGGNGETIIEPGVSRTGPLELTVEVQVADGTMSLTRSLAKLPKLEHPRLLYSADEADEIRQRIAKYPLVFERYRRWLLRHLNDPSFVPDGFNKGHQRSAHDSGNWRAIAGLFTDIFMAQAGDRPFLKKFDPQLKGANRATSFQVDYEFASAQTVLYDLAAAISPALAERMRAQLMPTLLDAGSPPNVFAQVEQPLSPLERTSLAVQAGLMGNYLTYFNAHRGTMGGLLWQGLRSDCQCPIHSIARTFIFYRNFYRDRSLVEEGIWPGYYTYQNYAMPRYDHEIFLSHGGVRGGGEYRQEQNLPMRLASTSICRHPLETTRNELDALIAKLSAPPGANEDADVDALLTDANGVVPLYLALGWYDPAAPKVAWEELPPGMAFDREGAVAMKSDFGPQMTDIYFTSGIRDTVYRDQPNHLRVFKAGRMLLGTPVHDIDHGSPSSAWANAVVVGEGIPNEWFPATGYARMDERRVLDRNAPEVLGYAMRDYRLSSIAPVGSDYWFTGGHSGPGVFDLVLHSHGRHPFIEQGQLVAYRTSPAYDYAAGDATNVWPLNDVRELYRQVVFIRPDMLVVYDRGIVAEGKATRWLACTAPQLEASGSMFRVVNADAWLDGQFLLPESPQMKVTGAYAAGNRREGGTIVVNRLDVAAPIASTKPEYLVVMRAGTGQPERIKAELLREEGHAGARFDYGGARYEIRFNTDGPVGGTVRVEKDGAVAEEELPQKLEQTFRRWHADPRFVKWTTEPRFRYFVPPPDRRN